MIHAAVITDRAGNALGSDDLTIQFSLTPRATVTSTAADADPATPGVQILEGSQVPLHVTVDASVAVQTIQILANGAVVTTGYSAPADFTIMAPHITPDVQTLVVQAQVTDTRGFITLSSLIEFDLLRNVVPFGVAGSTPADRGVGINAQSITVTFTQDLDPSQTDTSGITLLDLGPDHQVGGGDDTVVPLDSVQTTGDQLIILAQQALVQDKYQLMIDPSAVADLSGDRLAAAYSIIFANYVVGPNTDVWIASTSGDWNNPSNWSSGAIPLPADDVIIDPLDAPVTVTHSAGTHSINSLNSTQAFVLSGGSLTVTAGASVVNNSFTATTGGSLIVQGVGASFAAAGAAAIDGANLTLSDGGAMSLPAGTTLKNGSLTIDNTAAGFSSLVDLTGSTVTLRNGGTADLHNVAKIDGASLFVSGGVTLALPGVLGYTGSSSTSSTMKADGAGSLIDLSSITSFAGPTANGALTVEAVNGSQVSLSHIAAIGSGHASFSADGTNSQIDLSALTSFTGTDGQSSIEATSDGTILLSLLAQLDAVDLYVAGTMATSSITSYTNGEITADGQNLDLSGLTGFSADSLILRNGGTADLHNLVTIDSSSFDIGGGVALALPVGSTYSANSSRDLSLVARGTGSVLDLTTAAGFSVQVGSGQLNIQALEGGLVDLHTLTSIASGHAAVLAEGTASVVDLSALTSFLGTDGSSSLSTWNGGTIRMGVLTQLDAVGLYVGGTMLTAQITSFTNSSGNTVGVVGDVGQHDSLYSAQMLDRGTWSLASNPDIGDTTSNTSTSIPHLSIEGAGDGTFDFYSFTVTQPDARVILDIDHASNNTMLLLLDQFGNSIAVGDDAPVSWGAGGSSSELDAYIQESLSPGVYYVVVGGYYSYTYGGGYVYGTALQPGDAYVLQVSVQGHAVGDIGGITADGTSVDLSGLTSFADDSLSLINGGTADLRNAANIDNASFDVNGGVTLALPAANSYSADTERNLVLRADGPGSVLDLSSLTSFTGQYQYYDGLMDIQAANGGFIDLSQVSGAIDGFARFLADGQDSTIDISAMTGFDGFSFYDNSSGQELDSGLQASNGGTIRMSQLTYLTTVDLYVGGTMDTSQIATFAYGNITVDGVFADFSSLVGSYSYYEPGALYGGSFTVTNGGSVNLPNITELDFYSLTATDGGILSLPYVRSLGSFYYVSLNADGWGSYLDLSSVTTWGGGSEGSISSSDGAQINLSGLRSLPTYAMVSAAPNYFQNEDSYYGGVIDLQSVTGADSVDFTAQSGGTLNLNPGTVTLTNSSVQLDYYPVYYGQSSISAGTLDIGQGSSLTGSGQISGDLVNESQVGFFDDYFAGTLSIAGNYRQTSTGVLNVGLGGYDESYQSSYDQLNAQSALLDGTLQVNLVYGFQPQAGDSFTILTAGSVSGTYAIVNLPPLLGDLIWIVSYDPGDVTLSVEHGLPQMVSAGAPPVAGQAANITLSMVQPLVAAAVDEWLASGLTASQADALEHVQVRVADLPSGYLGFASGNVIWIDQNAAGYGWFVDATPAESGEFSDSVDGHDLVATPGSVAYGRIDLLTVVAHELGHVIGLSDDNGSDLMGEFLSTGIRRFPASVVPAPSVSVPKAITPARTLSSSAAAVDYLFLGKSGIGVSRSQKTPILPESEIAPFAGSTRSSSPELQRLNHTDVSLKPVQSVGGAIDELLAKPNLGLRIRAKRIVWDLLE